MDGMRMRGADRPNGSIGRPNRTSDAADFDDVIELQRAAGNGAVTEALGRGGAARSPLAGAVASPGVLARLAVQRDGPLVTWGSGQGGGTTTQATGGGTAATPSSPGVPGGSGTIAAPPPTTGVQAGSGEPVGPEAQLAADSGNVTLTVVAKNFNVRSGRTFDFLHEPGVSIQASQGDLSQPVVQAAIAALNAHIRSHGDDLVEISVSPQVQGGPGGVGASVQAQAELHITASFSLTASSSVGISAPGGGSDPSQLRLGGTPAYDITWQPISIGTLFHLGSGAEARPPREQTDYGADLADARVISWVVGQLNTTDFSRPGADELDARTMVAELYDVMRRARSDTADWIMHGMPPAAQLPAGLSNGLRRAAELLVQANPSLATVRLVRASVMTANATGSGESLVRWIPITIASPVATAQPAQGTPAVPTP